MTRNPLRCRRVVGALAWLGGAGLLACAPAPVMIDAAPDLAITVDGAYEDWHGQFTRIDGGRSVGLGITSDGEHLYLCLVTRDLGVQTLLRRGGFTLWLDPAGGRDEKLGLRVAPLEGPSGSGDGDDLEGEPPTGGGAPLTPRIEIVRDGAEYGYQLAKPGADAAVDARTATHADVVAYEFRVALGEPLARPRSGSLDTALSPGARLGVGVVSAPLAEPDLPRGAPRPPEIKELRVWVVGVLRGA